MNRRCLLILAAAIALNSPARGALAQTLSASISSSEAEIGETLTVVVSVHDPSTASAPEPPKTNDFDIVMDTNPPQSSQRVSIINGRMESEREFAYTFYVTPRRAGLLLLPPFTRREGAELFRTGPIRVRVGKNSGTVDLLCEIKAPGDTVYLGQAVTLTLEVWIRKFFQAGIGTLAPETMWRLKDLQASNLGLFSGTDTERCGLREATRQLPDGGAADYYVFLLETTIYPSNPGELKFDDIRFTMDYPLQLGRRMLSLSLDRKRRLTVRPTAEPLIVKPLPTAGRPRHFNGAVGSYKIQTRAVPSKALVGDPITLTMTIIGDGPLDRLLPPKLQEVETLASSFDISGESLAGEIEQGRKSFNQTIRAKREDVKEIPPIPFAYFDPNVGSYRETKSQPIPIEVIPGERISLADMPASATRAATNTLPIGDNAEGLLANCTDPRLVLVSIPRSPLGTPAYGIFAAMPFIYLLARFMQRRAALLSGNVGLRRRRSAHRRAAGMLSSGSPSPAEVRAALAGYISDRCNAPPGALTRIEAVRLVKERGLDLGRIQRVDDLLARLEHAEYGGDRLADPAAAAREARALIDDLERDGL